MVRGVRCERPCTRTRGYAPALASLFESTRTWTRARPLAVNGTRAVVCADRRRLCVDPAGDPFASVSSFLGSALGCVSVLSLRLFCPWQQYLARLH